MDNKYNSKQDKTDIQKVKKSFVNKIEKTYKNKSNCNCSKLVFHKDEKKECIDCMYKDILYFVP